MRISVLVIAHNEERYIRKCIEALLHQTVKADEVVLVAHNCTDSTEAIAEEYPISIVPFSGPSGITYARIEGLKHVNGDIILCIDGDSYARNNWIETMIETLSRNSNILVGSWVKFKGTFFGWISNITNRRQCIRRRHPARWIWGSSMAFWGRDKNAVKEIFQKSITLSQELKLSRNPDDYWLVLFMGRRGNIEVTNATSVTNYVKEGNSIATIIRSTENVRNGNAMESFFDTYKG